MMDHLMKDHLAKAAKALELAERARKKGSFDQAWKYQHERLAHYLAHAKSERFTQNQILNLTSNVYADLANILRSEGKHEKALTYVVCALCSTDSPTKEQLKKLSTYAKRASADIKALENYISEYKLRANIRDIELSSDLWIS